MPGNYFRMIGLTVFLMAGPLNAKSLTNTTVVIKRDTKFYARHVYKYTAKAGDRVKIIKEFKCGGVGSLSSLIYKKCLAVKHPKYGIGYVRKRDFVENNR